MGGLIWTAVMFGFVIFIAGLILWLGVEEEAEELEEDIETEPQWWVDNDY